MNGETGGLDLPDAPSAAGPDDEFARAAQLIADAPTILVTGHLAPDGDALGSATALAALLRERGRSVVLYHPDPVPRTLRFLPHAGTFVKSLAEGASHALTVVLDCGDRKLLGEKFPPPAITGPLVVIDHHASGRPFGDVFACDPAASSAGVLVARLAAKLGWSLSRDAALGIYTSIVTDTGWFRYANTNAESLRLAAEIVERCGVEPARVAEQLGERTTVGRYRLLAAALASITLELGGKVAVMTVTEAMVKAAGATWEDTDGLVNYARALDGVEVGVFLATAKDNRGARVSLRSKGRIDAGVVCLAFGGGGHPGAAGCLIAGTVEEARAKILEALAGALAQLVARSV